MHLTQGPWIISNLINIDHIALQRERWCSKATNGENIRNKRRIILIEENKKIKINCIV